MNSDFKNCVRQAWSDVRSNKEWFTKSLSLALVMFVPILNFCAIGYCWGQGVNLINSKPLGKIVSLENFERGFFIIFYWFIYVLIFGLIAFLPSYLLFVSFNTILMGVGIFYFIITTLAFGLFFKPILCIFYTKGICNGYNKSFLLGKIIKVYINNIAQAIASYLIPLFISILILAIVATIFWFGFLLITIGIAHVANCVGTFAIFIFVLLFWIIILIFVIIFVYLCFILNVLAQQVISRSTAIFIIRYAPELIEAKSYDIY